MARKKGIFIFLLTLFSLGLIVFIGIMHFQFMNPDSVSSSEVEIVDFDNRSVGEENLQDDDFHSEDNDVKDSSEETDAEQTTTIRYVDADVLNVRSGPGTETEIVGTVTYNEEVEVEELNDADGWVHIKNNQIEGYVNGKYLREEKAEEE